MPSYDWQGIVIASRDLAEQIRREGSSVRRYDPGQSETEKSIAEAVGIRLRTLTDHACCRFKFDPATGRYNVRRDRVCDVLWSEYEGNNAILLPALQLWRFYVDIIAPLMLGPEPRLVRTESAGRPIVRLRSTFRTDAEMHDNAAEMVERMTAGLPEFEKAIESLAEATGIAPNSTDGQDERSTIGINDDAAAKPEMPQVDLKLNQVRYAGECHNVSPEGAFLMDKLVQHYPHAFAASSELSKPSRVKDSLPEAIRALIVAETGKGYRLNLG